MDPAKAPWQVSEPLPIIEGESLDGYVARVAATHHFPRMAELTQVAGAEANGRQHATFCSGECLAALADCLRIDDAVLLHHAPQWSLKSKYLNLFGLQVPSDYLHFAYRRYAPGGLRISPHHRALWMVRIFPFCSESWEYLLDRCPSPSCGRRLEWRRTLGVHLCDYCGEPLDRADAVPVPREYRGNLHKLVGLLHPNPSRRAQSREELPAKLVAMEAGDLLELACAVATVIDHRVTSPLRRKTARLGEQSEVIVPALARTWPLLTGWPHAFESYLARKINEQARGRGDGNGGASVRFVSRMQRTAMPAATRALIMEFFENCRGAFANGAGVTAIEVCRRTGAQLGSVVEMRRTGKLPSVLAINGHRLHVLIDMKAVENMAKTYKPRQSLTQSAWHLGVPTYTMRELVAKGELQQGQQPPGCVSSMSIDKASIEAFTRSIAARLSPADVQWGSRLPDLMLQISCRPKPWAKVLAAIQAGDLEAALTPGLEPLAQRIVLKDATVLGSSAFAPDEDMDWKGVQISKRDLADVLSLSAANFSRHVAFLLGPDHHGRPILMEEAITLSRMYASTAEIAHVLQLHHVAAHNLALHRGVKVVARGLFDRASLLARIPEMSGNAENRPSDTETVGDQARDGVFESHAKVDDARMRFPAYVRMRMGLQDGDTVYFELIENGVIVRTAAQAVAHAQALASRYPDGGSEAFLAMRRKDSGD